MYIWDDARQKVHCGALIFITQYLKALIVLGLHVCGVEGVV